MSEPVYNPADAIAAADRLQASMSELKGEIRELHVYGRRNRHLIWGLAVSLVFDVLLSVALFITFITAGNAQDTADRNRQTQISTCESTNAARQVSSNLWLYILDAAAKTPENQTEERRKQIADFRTYMLNSYAPRDCSRIGK
jgi:hypothetical protein